MPHVPQSIAAEGSILAKLLNFLPSAKWTNDICTRRCLECSCFMTYMTVLLRAGSEVSFDCQKRNFILWKLFLVFVYTHMHMHNAHIYIHPYACNMRVHVCARTYICVCRIPFEMYKWDILSRVLSLNTYSVCREAGSSLHLSSLEVWNLNSSSSTEPSSS